MRIRIVNSVVEGAVTKASMPAFPPFVTAEVDWLPTGRSSVECRLDAIEVQPALLGQIQRAEDAGVDGVVINCFMDPGLEPAREQSGIPVVGPAQSAMTLAITLGERFSVILPAASGIPIVRRQARVYTGIDRLASVRSVEIPVAELADPDRLVDGLVTAGRQAIDDDGAEVLILGCTGMSYVTDRARERLAGTGVPVLDPTLSAVGAVISQALQSVRHSGAAYGLPSWR